MLFYLKKYFSVSYLLDTLISLLIYTPIYSIKLSAPLSIANIYILRVNTYKLGEDDYFATKILFMLIAGMLLVPYIFIIAQGNYHEVLYSAFPAMLTSTLYLLLVLNRESKQST